MLATCKMIRQNFSLKIIGALIIMFNIIPKLTNSILLATALHDCMHISLVGKKNPVQLLLQALLLMYTTSSRLTELFAGVSCD
jgi:hypothetical protein